MDAGDEDRSLFMKDPSRNDVEFRDKRSAGARLFARNEATDGHGRKMS